MSRKDLSARVTELLRRNVEENMTREKINSAKSDRASLLNLLRAREKREREGEEGRCLNRGRNFAGARPRIVRDQVLLKPRASFSSKTTNPEQLGVAVSYEARFR